jgi:predicted transcriptional regulator
MANITLKVDDELLKKARDLANKRKTSINAIIRQKIAEFAKSDMSREAAVSSGCREIFSEDLTDGLEISGTKLVNPFA